MTSHYPTSVAQIVLSVRTMADGIIAAFISLKTRNSVLTLKLELLREMDQRLAQFVPRTECDIIQRSAAREVDALTGNVKVVQQQLGSVEQGLRRIID